MRTVGDPEALRASVRAWKQAGQRVAFVPTMGNLHAGHVALVERARALADRVVVSIFVNPLQFGPSEDFNNYPRTLEADKAKLAEARADLLFVPAVEEMYPGGMETTVRVEVPALSAILDGRFRPGHFTGVATVVARLFNMVQPDVAVFGEKDYQQLAVIRALVRQLAFPIEVVGLETVREADGLALSSRNQYLKPEERARAPLLFRVLSEIVLALRLGRRDFSALQEDALRKLAQGGFRPEYVEVREAVSLAAPSATSASYVVLAAAWLGRARLIDNIAADVAA